MFDAEQTTKASLQCENSNPPRAGLFCMYMYG